MTLVQIHYFLTITKFGSYSRAAQELFITQPALTRSMRELESELGLELFHRSGRGVVLSREGEKFLYEARDLYRQYEELKSRYCDPEKIRQSFSVCTQHYSFAVQAFVNLVQETGTRNYEFSIKEGKTREVIADVSSMRSEIGILYQSNFNARIIQKILQENNLDFHPLITCHAYVYITDDHPLAARSSVTFEDLRPYICLSFEQGEDASYYLAEELFASVNVPRKIMVNDRATMLNLMNGLHGYTICSGIIYEELNGDGYTAVPIENEAEEEMLIGYIHRKNLALSSLAERYIEKLQSVLMPYKDRA